MLFGQAPYGWKLSRDRSHLVMERREQRVITIARHMRARGLTLRAIVWELQELGVLNRLGRTFSLPQVYRIVNAPRRPPPESRRPSGASSVRRGRGLPAIAWSPRSSPPGWKGTLLSVRVSAGEKVALDLAAKRAGVPASTWARRVLLAATPEFDS